MKEFDVLVIGAGPGGYVAAIRCAQLGMKTACVDAWLGPDGKPSLGGTCLNVGCIPSKALLDTSHHYHDLGHLLPQHGIQVKEASIDIAAMQRRKNKVVKTLTMGIAGLFRKNKVEWLQGYASLKGDMLVDVTPNGGGDAETVKAGNIIIATGSVPIDIPVAKLDGERIVDSSGALAFAEVPARLGVIGAGVIGLELGSVWNRLGSEVVVLEALPDFLAAADRDVAKETEKLLRMQGLDIRLGAKVTGSELSDTGVKVNYETSEGSDALEVDKLIVAVGRRPQTGKRNAEAAGLKLDPRGAIITDGQCRTDVAGIYAIGDVVIGPMLAHKASEEGVAVAEMIAGQKPHIDHATVPWVIYTNPEVAWVGKTEHELKAEGVDYRMGFFPFRAIGRSHGAGDTNGFVKILGDTKTDRILGVHILGAQASEIIAEAVVAMEFGGSTEDLARIIHAHPTRSEAVHEAALAVDGRALHM
ncbi:MAG: dihydrolipoyl dehydrogenase [Gammaproteobacteria bacterium]|nr:MAG: dihydrolipoyl dehydrogenase [Gammaproteobacteria bacterium]